MKNFSNKSRVIIESFDHTVHDIDEDVKSFLLNAVRQRIINEQSEAEKALAALSDEPGATVQDGAFKGLGRGALKGVIAMEKSDDEEKKKKAEELSQETESQKLEKDLDYEVTQGKLAAAGMTPAVGIGADLAAAGHSLMHGKLGDVGVNLLAAIPLVGLGTRAATTAVKTKKIADAVADVGSATSATRKAKVKDAVKELDAAEAAKAEADRAKRLAASKRESGRIEALEVDLPKPKVDKTIKLDPETPRKPSGYKGPDPRLDDTPVKPKVDTPVKPKVDTPTKPKVDTPTKPKVNTPSKPKETTPKTDKDKKGNVVSRTLKGLSNAALGYEGGRIGYNLAVDQLGRPDLQTKDDTLAHAVQHATRGDFGAAGKSVKQAYEANPVPSVIAGVIKALPGVGKVVSSGLESATGIETGDITDIPAKAGEYLRREAEKKFQSKTHQRETGQVK